MLKCGLLATTAFVVVGSLSLLASHSWALARSATAGPGRNTNDEFLCAYGYFPVSDRYSASSGTHSSSWTHVAVPVVGRGQTVDRITVREGGGSFPSHSGFSVGIYESNNAGFPGKMIARTGGTTHRKCKRISMQITPTTLEKGKTYWVEETVPFPGFSSSTEVLWAINPKTKLKAYVQTHHHSGCCEGHEYQTSPWMEQSTGPYVQLR